MRVPVPVAISLALEPLRLRLDVLLLRVVALLLLTEPFRERVELGALAALEARRLRELRLELEPEATVPVLPDHPPPVQGPPVGGPPLRRAHPLPRVVPPPRRERQVHPGDRR